MASRMSRGIILLLFCIMVSSTAISARSLLVSGVLMNSPPVIENATISDSNGLLPDRAITLPDTVTVNASASDLNGNADLVPSNSSCRWSMDGYSTVTPIVFSGCQGMRCSISCSKTFGITDPVGGYIVTVSASDHEVTTSINLSFMESVPTPPPSFPSFKSMTVYTELVCPAGVVIVRTAEADGNPLAGARVYFIRNGWIYAGELTTASDGTANLSLEGNRTYLLIANKDGYNSVEENVYIASCPSVPPTVQKPSCVSDADCRLDQSCVNQTCEQVSGICGQAVDHRWVPFECCSDSDCALGQKCVSNMCANITTNASYDLFVPPEIAIGGNITVIALSNSQPYPDAIILVTQPDGGSFVLITDAQGKAVLYAGYKGQYKVSLVVEGKSVKTSSLMSYSVVSPPLPPPIVVAQPPVVWPWFLILLIALIIVYVLWRRKGSGKAAIKKSAR